MKRISHFQYSTRLTEDAANAHYLDIHHPFARDALAQSESVIRYSTHTVTGQYDVAGRFRQKSDLWRLVITENRDAPSASGATDDWLPDNLKNLFWYDHTNFLRDLHSYEVDEKVIIDNRSGQTIFEKFIFQIQEKVSEVSSDPVQSPDIATFVGRFADSMKGFPGARLLIWNSAVAELETEAILEPGQRFTGRRCPTPTALSFLEVFFDNATTSADFFSSTETRDLIHCLGLDVIGMHVIEKCGLDCR